MKTTEEGDIFKQVNKAHKGIRDKVSENWCLTNPEIAEEKKEARKRDKEKKKGKEKGKWEEKS